MTTFFRLLSFCRPFGKYVLPFTIFTFLNIFFGLLNLTLLVPLMNVLFDNTSDLVAPTSLPHFEFSKSYAENTFNYYFLNTINEFGKFAALKFVCIFIVSSVLLSNIFRYLSIISMEYFKSHVVRVLRNKIFYKYSTLDINYFNNKKKGDLMTRLTNDSIEIEHSIASSLEVVFSHPVSIIMYFVALFSISVKLTFFTLILVPLSGGLIAFFAKKLKKDSKESFNSLGVVNSILEETLTAVKIIAGFNAQPYIQNRFKNQIDNLTKINRKIFLSRELSSPFSEFMGVSIVAIILLYGGNLVLNNQSELSSSAFIAYITIFSQVLRPAKGLSSSLIIMQRGMVAGERMIELLDTKSTIEEKSNPEELKSFEKNIKLENISFAYGDKVILKNINLEIPKGCMVALVGPSGGGKSTLADLLPRFNDPKSGKITIDGVDIKNFSLQSLRSQMGIVTQESILFNDSIYNNIVFGLEGATQEMVENAAKIANAHEFIVKTDQGYETTIGDRGIKLSGGQKQRINIARAVLRNPSIFILDEATSALDNESEKLVQEALENLMKNRTSIVIAHRLSTIQHADIIVVIKDGEIAEIGKHADLLSNESGIYRRLNQLQLV